MVNFVTYWQLLDDTYNRFVLQIRNGKECRYHKIKNWQKQQIYSSFFDCWLFLKSTLEILMNEFKFLFNNKTYPLIIDIFQAIVQFIKLNIWCPSQVYKKNNFANWKWKSLQNANKNNNYLPLDINIDLYQGY